MRILRHGTEPAKPDIMQNAKHSWQIPTNCEATLNSLVTSPKPREKVPHPLRQLKEVLGLTWSKMAVAFDESRRLTEGRLKEIDRGTGSLLKFPEILYRIRKDLGVNPVSLVYKEAQVLSLYCSPFTLLWMLAWCKTSNLRLDIKIPRGIARLPGYLLVQRTINARTLEVWFLEKFIYPDTFSVPFLFSKEDFTQLGRLIKKLRCHDDPVSEHVWSCFCSNARAVLRNPRSSKRTLKSKLAQELNRSIESELLFDPRRFEHVQLSLASRLLLASKPSGEELTRLNRLLLEDAFPNEIRKSHRTTHGYKYDLRSGRGVNDKRRVLWSDTDEVDWRVILDRGEQQFHDRQKIAARLFEDAPALKLISDDDVADEALRLGIDLMA